MIALRILGEPDRVFYRSERALWLSGLGAPHALLRGLGVLRAGTSGEAPNMTAALDNTGGRFSALFAAPPLGAVAVILDDGAEVFRGTVHDISIDSEAATLSLESDLARPLPLRMTTAWGGFREAEPIPHRYGTTGGRLIQYNATRTQFCWADHACEGIDEVLVEGQPAGEWQWRTAVDPSGHVVTIVEFGQPVPEGATLIARGRGKLHPLPPTQRMTNPATIVWDVLANIAGWPVPESALDEFRRRCDVLGIEVGGSIETAESAQTVARAICTSVGAEFCAQAPGLCALIDGDPASAPRRRIDIRQASSACSLSDMTNDLTLEYAIEDGSARASVQVEALDYIARHGRRADTVRAPWVVSSRVAVATAARLLAARARPTWRTRVPGVRGRVDVFEALAVEGAASPPVARGVDIDLESGRCEVEFLARVGDAPAITLARQSSAFEPAQYVGATQTAIGTDRVWTITEADGSPVVGASVTANGFTRTTDTAGRVAFPQSALPPGSYTLLIRTLDGRSWPLPVVIT